MSTALAVRPAGSFVALAQDSGAARLIIDDLLGGEPLGIRDLPIVKVPAAGKTKWERPDGEYVTEISGILLMWTRTHQYWPTLTPDESPPSCRSTGPDRTAFGTGPNGGPGDPGGPCAQCPLNVMGTAVREDGSPAAGKRCTERELWFLLPEGSMMPWIIDLSPSSLANAAKYRRQTLVGMMDPKVPLNPMHTVVTALTIIADKNDGTPEFGRAVPRILEHLDPVEAAGAAEYAVQFAPEMERAAAEASTAPIGEE